MIKVFKKFKDLLDVSPAWGESAGKFWKTKADGSGLETADIPYTSHANTSPAAAAAGVANGHISCPVTPVGSVLKDDGSFKPLTVDGNLGSLIASATNPSDSSAFTLSGINLPTDTSKTYCLKSVTNITASGVSAGLSFTVNGAANGGCIYTTFALKATGGGRIDPSPTGMVSSVGYFSATGSSPIYEFCILKYFPVVGWLLSTTAYGHSGGGPGPMIVKSMMSPANVGVAITSLGHSWAAARIAAGSTMELYNYNGDFVW